jgi:hypothetical protein
VHPAPTSHTAFVRMLQVLKGRPEVREQLGFRDAKVFRSYIDSLLELAGRIERLSPERAGLTQPNPEYPWEDQGTHEVCAPAEYEFPGFDPRDPRMIKLDRLLGNLLRRDSDSSPNVLRSGVHVEQFSSCGVELGPRHLRQFSP